MNNIELTIELTNYCLNNCIQCSASATKINPIFIGIESIKSVIDEVKPSRVILSGGEPLLHPQISEIIELLKKMKLLISLDTAMNVDTNILPSNLHLIDDFFISYYSLDNENYIRSNCVTKPLYLVNVLRMLNKTGHFWFNTIMFNRNQMLEMAFLCYALECPVHVIKLVRHGDAKNIVLLSKSEQVKLANEMMNELNPSLIDYRMPEFLKADESEFSFLISKDVIKEKLEKIYKYCRISHSLTDECRCTKKRTLLSNGRIIGCIAGKERNENFNVIKACDD